MDVATMIVSALVAAVVGGIAGEWRSRAAEKRALARELEAEARAQKRDRIRVEQDDLIAQIEDTRKDFMASRQFLMAWRLGDAARMAEVPRGRGSFGQAQWYLIGDETLIRQVFDFDNAIFARKAGTGISDEDMAKMGATTGHVNARLDAQRALVREGKHPIYPSAAFIQQMLDLVSERYGIPPEYRPKLDPDAPTHPPGSALDPAP